MTSEHVQRLAEWLEIKAPQVWAQFSAKATAQEALDASGATARIDELEVMGRKEFDAYREALARAEQAEQRIEVLDAQVLFVEQELDKAEKRIGESEKGQPEELLSSYKDIPFIRYRERIYAPGPAYSEAFEQANQAESMLTMVDESCRQAGILETDTRGNPLYARVNMVIVLKEQAEKRVEELEKALWNVKREVEKSQADEPTWQLPNGIKHIVEAALSQAQQSDE